MEYVEGSDLAAWVKKHGVMPPAQALNCLVQAARGLEYAHRHGVVHRDIKPANLLLDREGTVKILDMGLARLESAGEHQDELTGSGQIMGTVDYMAPEQAVSTRQADARADIYSLGVTLWYLLTARPMYGGDSAMAKLLAHQNQPIPSLRAQCPTVSPALEAVFLKMVAKAPADRYQNMTEVIAELEKCAGSEAAAPSLRSTAGEDTRLEEFLRGMGQPAASGASPSARTLEAVAPAGLGVEPAVTITLGQPQSDTNPQLPQPVILSAARPAAVPTTPLSKRLSRRPKTPILIALAAGGVLALLLGIWVIVRDKDGNEVARVRVPDGGQVEVGALKKAATASPKTANTAPRPSAATPPPPPAVAPFDAAQAEKHQQAWASHLGLPVEFTNGMGIKFRLIPPGQFVMGSPETEQGRESIDKGSEKQHEVEITKPFYLGTFEVTQQQYEKLTGKNPSSQSPQGKDRERVKGLDTRSFPVESVSWNDAKAFCQKLAEQEREKAFRYRLPTEAEWEYAFRAGTTTVFYVGDTLTSHQGNFIYKFPYGTDVEGPDAGHYMPVGSYAANPFGLYDMIGNVCEWCEDAYEYKSDYYSHSPRQDPRNDVGRRRARRGGGASAMGVFQRAAVRFSELPTHTMPELGFRLVLEIDDALRRQIARTGQPAAAPLVAKAPFDAAQARKHQEAWAKHLGTTVETTNSAGMKMILIPPGEFLMGSSDKQVQEALAAAERIAPSDQSVKSRIERSERPQHRVVITRPLWIGATEVTVGQFKRFAAATRYVTAAEQSLPASTSTYLNPGYPVTDDSPAASLNFTDAAEFCKWLSAEEKAHYRLPTEAEWEYACRAGTTTQFSFGDDETKLDNYAWFETALPRHPRSVGMKLPNPFGLYDMHGNVFEWCQDFFRENWYQHSTVEDPRSTMVGTNRPVRGGGWNTNASNCRSADRSNFAWTEPKSYFGFRVVRETPSVSAASTSASPSTTSPARSTAPPRAAAPFDAAQAKQHQEAWAKHLGTTVETTNSVGAKMILIPPGEFLMGSSDEQIAAVLKVAEGIQADAPIKYRIQQAERPPHRVVITRPLFMGATEVTIGQFKKFSATGYRTEAEKARAAVTTAQPSAAQEQPATDFVPTYLNPGYAVTEDSPACAIGWNDAVAFCRWLSEQEKGTYRLPTEAEWEYACRAGTTTQYCFGDDARWLEQYAWYSTNAEGVSHPVGTRLANAFGIHDLHGNLWEWCHDFFDETYYASSPAQDPSGPSAGPGRLLRGGSFSAGILHSRSAYRHYYGSPGGMRHQGFRVVREVKGAAN